MFASGQLMSQWVFAEHRWWGFLQITVSLTRAGLRR